MTDLDRHFCAPITYEGRTYPGCLGMTLSCFHSFSCAADPAIDKHRCAASWTPVLWSLFLAVAAGTFVLLVTMR